MKTLFLVTLTGLLFVAADAPGQIVLFDFENAQVGSSLPLNLTANGLTASFSSTGLGGFYIQQPQNTILYTPVGFSGNCLNPTSINAADLHIGFSQALTNFSVLYAPHELACDSSATMRVTAYMNGTLVGTATTNAVAGTWPSETLRFSSTQAFNSMVVHYDAPPITGGDYGTVFVVDNVIATLASLPPTPPLLQISWANNQIQIAWPTNTSIFTLEGNTNLLNTAAWVSVTNAPMVSGSHNTVTLHGGADKMFYRLAGR